MFIQIKLIPEFRNGYACGLYSVSLGNESKTLFEHFLQKAIELNEQEALNILGTLKQISTTTGAKRIFFREKHEGWPDDRVEALFDPNAEQPKLRLYCLLFDEKLLLLGDGEIKNVRAIQDDAKLMATNYPMRRINDCIEMAFKNGQLSRSDNGLRLIGELTIECNQL